jgi:SRSO17 transposase
MLGARAEASEARFTAYVAELATWREGSADWLASRFARVRVRAAHRDERLSRPRDEEWLLIEWAQGEAEPSKYWLSTMPQDMPFADLVDLAKLRWRDPSATITSSSRRSGSAITRAAAGAASTTTPHCASRPTAS